MMFNGFKPNESRTHTMPARKGDRGHSLVTMVTTRRGHEFAFRYQAVCQCGQTFATAGNRDSLFYRHSAHMRENGAGS